MSKRVLITGSSGLVGSECVRHFDRLGWEVRGLDGNQRRFEFFGADGDTRANREKLEADAPNVRHCFTDIRILEAVEQQFKLFEPDLVIHCAAQPSHDLATKIPFVDFQTNAVGTLNLLEATRQYAPNATFIFCSTNKVYGDAPNSVGFRELPTRWELHGIGNFSGNLGFDETLPIDQSRHSLFGVSKAAADLMVQEYGRTFGMNTACFRMGCITGSAHAGTEQHGFLAYLAKCIREDRPYKVYGYKGKQVRDNLHASDVAHAFELFADNPKQAAVYNLGGGRRNSVSVIEAIKLLEEKTGKRLKWSYVDEARGGDHICYYTDTRKFRSDYPDWSPKYWLDDIIDDLCEKELVSA